ncbi:MAG: hypothetical protein AAGG01_24030, partial [Planctomycetota bacterium]
EATWRKEVNGICPGSREAPDGAPKSEVSLHSADRVDAIAKATEDWYEDRLETWPGEEFEL